MMFGSSSKGVPEGEPAGGVQRQMKPGSDSAIVLMLSSSATKPAMRGSRMGATRCAMLMVASWKSDTGVFLDSLGEQWPA